MDIYMCFFWVHVCFCMHVHTQMDICLCVKTYCALYMHVHLCVLMSLPVYVFMSEYVAYECFHGDVIFKSSEENEQEGNVTPHLLGEQ